MLHDRMPCIKEFSSLYWWLFSLIAETAVTSLLEGWMCLNGDYQRMKERAG